MFQCSLKIMNIKSEISRAALQQCKHLSDSNNNNNNNNNDNNNNNNII